jgi:hypothetical protein
MGLTPLTVLSTFLSLDFILLLLFMNNGLVRWYLPLLVNIDAKISVVLQPIKKNAKKSEVPVDKALNAKSMASSSPRSRAIVLPF